MNRFVIKYQRRRPEDTLLYQIIQKNLLTVLQNLKNQETHFPKYITKEFYSFLKCGILSYGFLRVHCKNCRKDKLVAFSCKGRGICPSCGARRMVERSAHLVDKVIPHVRVRHKVKSFKIFPKKRSFGF